LQVVVPLKYQNPSLQIWQTVLQTNFSWNCSRILLINRLIYTRVWSAMLVGPFKTNYECHFIQVDKLLYTLAGVPETMWSGRGSHFKRALASQPSFFLGGNIC
jgi:hypothetical protein